MKMVFLIVGAILIAAPALAGLKADAKIVSPAEMAEAYRLADCVVVRDPKGAQQVLRTLPGSKENGDANRALVPVVEACWKSQSNGDLQIGGALMRGSLAEVVYHRITASQGVVDANPYAASEKDEK